jgi:hypothetical protein
MHSIHSLGKIPFSESRAFRTFADSSVLEKGFWRKKHFHPVSVGGLLH